MQTLVNFFLSLFLVDGALSVANVIFSKSFGFDGLIGIQILNALITLLLACAIYLGFAFNKNLPKLPLLPFSIFCIWGAFGGWPLNNYFDADGLNFTISMVQLNMAVLYLFYRRSQGKTYLIPRDSPPEKQFDGRRFITFFALHLLLSPVIFLYISLATLSIYADTYTERFVRVKPTGIYMADRLYAKEGKTIRLTAMVHVGQEDYYQRVTSTFPTKDAVILAEGVSDKDKLLQNGLGYDKLAARLGLASQKEFPLPGKLVSRESFSNPDFTDAANEPHIVHIDADVSIFQHGTIDFLKEISRQMNTDLPLGEKLMAYNEWATTEMPPERMEAVMNDILHKRNQILIDGIEQALKHYDQIVIPWGALHMPEIAAYITGQGFIQQENREVISIPFADLLLALFAGGDDSLETSTVQ